jgi:molybdenum cofactor cytidylyltransferase
LISGIVLAGGKSERMGRPKALLPFRGGTFLSNILAAIAQSPLDHAYVVAGHHRREIESAVSGEGASVVFNPDYEQGMVTSLQAGIRALPPQVAGAMMFLVDHPLVDPATIKSLVTELLPGRIVVPVFAGRRGHPVLFAAGILAEILSLPPSEGPNSVVRRDARRVIEVPIGSRGVLIDVDTPQQFEKLLEEER